MKVKRILPGSGFLCGTGAETGFGTEGERWYCETPLVGDRESGEVGASAKRPESGVAESRINGIARKQPQYIEKSAQVAVSPISTFLAAFFQMFPSHIAVLYLRSTL
jgi:hypothetical protein